MATELKTKTGSDVKAVVTRIFGDEGAIQVTESDIINFINRAQQEVVLNNYELNQKILSLNSSSIADGVIPLDSYDILRINALTLNGVLLDGLSISEALVRKRNSQDESFWWYYANAINFHPETTTGSVEIYYNSSPKPLNTISDTLDVPDQSFNQIIDWVLKYCYELDEDVQKMQVKMQDIDRGIENQRMDVLTQSAYYPVIQEVD